MTSLPAVYRAFAARIDAATPPQRDRAVDALRAFAILGVVLGHWLVTALVLDSGTLKDSSPLQHLPQLDWVSWLFQTLAVFFLVGGNVAASSYAAAQERGADYPTWLAARFARLTRPVAAVLAVWAAVAGALLVGGVNTGTVVMLVKLVLSPLWFLLVFAALTAATPLVRKLHPLWPLAVVLYVDVARFGFHQPGWLAWINLPAGWLVPYCLGAAWAREGVASRRTGWVLLLGGAAATVLLVRYAGYPASMVGVPGGRISNLNPPTLASVTFGLAQCGAALLLLGPLRRWLARPGAWAWVALLNLSAMTVFLWHQTAMITATSLGLLVAGGPVVGLHTAPDTTAWVLARLLWLPAFATVLAGCWAAFRHYEQPHRRSAQRRRGPQSARRRSRIVRSWHPHRPNSDARSTDGHKVAT